MNATAGPSLALFDLDHTLLTGDTDVLWTVFLIAHGAQGSDKFCRNLI